MCVYKLQRRIQAPIIPPHTCIQHIINVRQYLIKLNRHTVYHTDEVQFQNNEVTDIRTGWFVAYSAEEAESKVHVWEGVDTHIVYKDVNGQLPIILNKRWQGYIVVLVNKETQ